MTCPRCQSKYVVTDVSGRRHWCGTCALGWHQGQRFNHLKIICDEIIKPAIQDYLRMILEEDIAKAKAFSGHRDIPLESVIKNIEDLELPITDYDKDDE